MKDLYETSNFKKLLSRKNVMKTISDPASLSFKSGDTESSQKLKEDFRQVRDRYIWQKSTKDEEDRISALRNIDCEKEAERLFGVVVHMRYCDLAHYYDSLLDAVCLLHAGKNTFNQFLAFSKEHQEILLLRLPLLNLTDEVLESYLYTLTKAGRPRPMFIYENVQKLEYLLERETSSDELELQLNIGIEFEELTEPLEFLETFGGDDRPNWAGVKTTLYLLRHIYGEELMVEVLTRREIEKADLTILEICKLLQDYEKLKHHPLAWAIEFTEDLR